MTLTDSGQREEEYREEFSADVQASIYYALGQGVVQAWSGLPQEIQQDIFEATVKGVGDRMRDPIAIFCMGSTTTPRALQARAMPEPDSKGG
jgi:hypothetical protein